MSVDSCPSGFLEEFVSQHVETDRLLINTRLIINNICFLEQTYYLQVNINDLCLKVGDNVYVQQNGSDKRLKVGVTM